MSIRQGRPEDYSKGPYLIVLDVAPCPLTFASVSTAPVPLSLVSPPPRFLDHRHSWTSLLENQRAEIRNVTASARLSRGWKVLDLHT